MDRKALVVPNRIGEFQSCVLIDGFGILLICGQAGDPIGPLKIELVELLLGELTFS